MPRRKSFLITLIPAEDEPCELCGQVKSIATGETNTFSNIEELKNFLYQEVNMRTAPVLKSGATLEQNVHLTN